MRLIYYGKSGFNLKTLNNGSFSELKYSLLSDVKSQVNSHTLLPWCNFIKIGDEKLNHFDPDSCSLFQPVFTDYKLCHAFNPLPPLSLLKPSFYTKVFENTFADDFPTIHEIFNGTKDGHTLDFYLLGSHHNYNDMEENGMYFEDSASRFFLSLSNKNEYFNMKANGQEIQAGQHIFWNVYVTEIVPDEEIFDIPSEKRNCKFEDEIEGLEMFKLYTQSACEFEAKVKKAQYECRCLPWFIPSRERFQICDLFGNYCFNHIYDNTEVDRTKCLPSCHQIQFNLDQHVEKLSGKELCQNEYSTESFINAEVSDGNIFLKIQKLKQYFSEEGYDEKYNYPKELIKLCEKLVKKDLARITVSFGSKRYVRAKINKRASFSDKLGTFGKLK